MIEEINVQFNEQVLNKHIERKLDEAIQSKLWFVTVDRLVELTCICKRSLEQDILTHPAMRQIEMRKGRKRYYEAAKAFEVIKEILSSWD